MQAHHLMHLGRLSGMPKLGAALRHNKRAIQRELGANSHIDARRIPLNYSLTELQTHNEIYERAKAMMQSAGVTKLRKNGVSALEILFSLPVGSMIDHKAFFADCFEYAKTEFSPELILSADVHLDESAKHMHILILPLIEGRMQGDAMAGDKRVFYERQNRFYQTVAAKYGLKKPPSKFNKQALSKAVLLHMSQTQDPAQKSPVWAAIRDAIGNNPLPFAEAFGIEPQAPQPKMQRTMAQIFTSKGKGGRIETEKQNPIRGLMPQSTEPLSCVRGFIRNGLETLETRPYYP